MEMSGCILNAINRELREGEDRPYAKSCRLSTLAQMSVDLRSM